MNVRAIKSAEAEAAINRIKRITRKEVKDVCHEVPQEFIEKRNYMQSDEFINDEHNKKMLELGDDLFVYRTNIGNELKMLNSRMGNKFVQAINGFVRLKSDIEKDFFLNFEPTPVIYTPSEEPYRLIKNIQIFSEIKKL